MIRHFTATAVILEQSHVVLIEHRKLGWMLPPGGHIEPNEDPVQAVCREVKEEVGLDIEILSERPFSHPAIEVVEAPFTILIEDILDPEFGDHQHIDFIYVAAPDGRSSGRNDIEYDTYEWVPISAVGKVNTKPELADLVRAADQYATRILEDRGAGQRA